MKRKGGARVTVKDIARDAGVSPATVSLALRDDPRIADETARKVKETAQRLGYRPDPHLSHLMGYLQRDKARGGGSVIGILSDFTEAEMRAHAYLSLMLSGVEERCAQLGYKPTIFSLGKGVGLKRMRAILEARGIQGLVLMPFRNLLFRMDDFDFSIFSVVAIGYGLQSPQLNRAASQQTLAAMRVVEHVMQSGYQRIGVVLPQEIDQRTHHRYLAGFLGQIASKGNPSVAIPPFLFQKLDREALRAWIRKHRIEAIVSSSRELPEVLEELGMRLGEDIALAMVDYRGTRPVAHMEVPYAAIGKAAINLVHGQLSVNERGIPELAAAFTVPGIWNDGPSLPPRTR